MITFEIIGRQHLYVVDFSTTSGKFSGGTTYRLMATSKEAAVAESVLRLNSRHPRDIVNRIKVYRAKACDPFVGKVGGAR